MDKSVSERIQIARWLLISAVVALHVPPYVALDESGGGLGFCKAFVQHGLGRATVPMLTVISGYLLFAAGLDRRPGLLLAKKARSLLLPLLLWNLPFVVALRWVQSEGGSGHVFRLDLAGAGAWRLLDATLGLSDAPVNFPLFFLRDLFVLCLLAPLLGPLLRRWPLACMALVTALFLADLDGPLVMRDTMAVNFAFGGLVALHARERVLALDRWRLPALLTLLALCAAIALGLVERSAWWALGAPLLVWPALSYVQDRPRLAAWIVRQAPTSFLIFCAHGPVLLATWLAWQRRPLLPYPAYWLLAPIVTIATIMGATRFIRTLPPRPAAHAFRRPITELGLLAHALTRLTDHGTGA